MTFPTPGKAQAAAHDAFGSNPYKDIRALDKALDAYRAAIGLDDVLIEVSSRVARITLSYPGFDSIESL
jgi:hypothetical protein